MDNNSLNEAEPYLESALLLAENNKLATSREINVELYALEY